MWTTLIVAHKVQKKVFNFIKRSKEDFQKQISISESDLPVSKSVTHIPQR